MARKISLDEGPVVRRAILDVGARLYSDRGFSATSIRDLADVTGISSSTIYHHFSNKQEILYEILRSFMQNFVAEIVPVLSETTMSPSVRITRAVGLHLEISERDRLQLVIGSSVKSALSPEQNRTVSELQRVYRQAFLATILDGIDQGELEAAQPALTTSAVLDMLNGVREWLHEGGSLTLEQIIAYYQGLALSMLGAAGTTTTNH